MAKGTLIGVNGTAQKVKKIYIGDGNNVTGPDALGTYTINITEPIDYYPNVSYGGTATLEPGVYQVKDATTNIRPQGADPANFYALQVGGMEYLIRKTDVANGSGVARKVTKGYIGDANGIARQFYSLGPSGTTWIGRTAPVTDSWKSVCYGNGMFVAVANSGTGTRLMSSPDGINWTNRTPGWANMNWEAVCFGDGLFVAINSGGYPSSTTQVMTSPDGITWTGRIVPVKSLWMGICHGNGRYVAIDGGSPSEGYLLTSTDGTNWSFLTAPSKLPQYSICYGNGRFVSLSSGATVWTSTNGTTWTTVTAPANTNAWRSVCYGNGMFVALAQNGTISNKVMTSTDGTTWVLRAASVANNWRSVCFGDGLFVAVADSGTGNRVMTSPDGINWTTQVSAADNAWSSVCYGDGTFVAVSTGATGSNRVMTAE